jgi:hypothetical protein
VSGSCIVSGGNRTIIVVTALAPAVMSAMQAGVPPPSRLSPLGRPRPGSPGQTPSRLASRRVVSPLGRPRTGSRRRLATRPASPRVLPPSRHSADLAQGLATRPASPWVPPPSRHSAGLTPGPAAVSTVRKHAALPFPALLPLPPQPHPTRISPSPRRSLRLFSRESRRVPAFG